MSRTMAITDTDLDYLESLHGKLAGAFASMDGEGRRESIPIVATGVGRALHVLVRATAARIAHGSSGPRLVWARRSSCTGERAIAACPFGSMRT